MMSFGEQACWAKMTITFGTKLGLYVALIITTLFNSLLASWHSTNCLLAKWSSVSLANTSHLEEIVISFLPAATRFPWERRVWRCCRDDASCFCRLFCSSTSTFDFWRRSDVSESTSRRKTFLKIERNTDCSKGVQKQTEITSKMFGFSFQL